MEYRRLGRTGRSVSVFGIGTWQLAGPVSVDGEPDGHPDVGEAEVHRILHGMEERGVNLVDTAPIYGGGEGELRVGRALVGRRDRWCIVSKVGNDVRNGRRLVDRSPTALRASVEASLRRLQTDHIDILLLHTMPTAAQTPAVVDTMRELQQEGKIGWAGVSTDDADAVQVLAERGGVQVLMAPRSVLDPGRRMAEVVQRHGLGWLVRGALGSGLLSGRYFDQEPRFQPTDIRQGSWFPVRQVRFLRRYVPAESSPTTLALRAVLDRSDSHCVVLGGKSLAHYETALAALDAPAIPTWKTKAIEVEARAAAVRHEAEDLARRAVRKGVRWLRTRDAR
jgi:aryl-alcohol dehydrogenase-like predicted oxidoreductase